MHSLDGLLGETSRPVHRPRPNRPADEPTDQIEPVRGVCYHARASMDRRSFLEYRPVPVLDGPGLCLLRNESGCAYISYMSTPNIQSKGFTVYGRLYRIYCRKLNYAGPEPLTVCEERVRKHRTI